MTDERELLRRAVRGDRDAFGALVRPRWDLAWRVALRVVGDPEEAKDVVQAACLDTWRNAARIRPEQGFEAWFLRTVVHRAIDALRRRRARPEELRDELPEPPRPRPGTRGPAAELETRQLEEALRDATSTLSPRRRAVFVLCRVEGWSVDRAARVLGMSPSTVRSHLQEARREVSRHLAGRWPGFPGGPGGDR